MLKQSKTILTLLSISMLAVAGCGQANNSTVEAKAKANNAQPTAIAATPESTETPATKPVEITFYYPVNVGVLLLK